jgi:hypothetical protein
MKDTELENKADTELAIKKLLDFNLAQESYESMFHRKEELRLLVNRNQSLSELLDILRLAVRSNARELVKVLVEEKGVIPDTDTLHYALANTEMSTKFSKMDQEYSVEILKYLMRQTKYMKAELDSPQEKLDLQEKQESFIQDLSEPQCMHISDSIWNKDQQNIEFSNSDLACIFLYNSLRNKIHNCQGFIVETNTSALTIYAVVKNRLIASAYFEKYSEITKVSDGYIVIHFPQSIQLMILQFPGFYITRETYPEFLVEKIVRGEIENATAMQALLRCRDENGQVMLGGKVQDKEWCRSLYSALRNCKLESIANSLNLNYDTIKLIPEQDWKGSYLQGQKSISLFMDQQLLLAKTASAKHRRSIRKKKQALSLSLIILLQFLALVKVSLCNIFPFFKRGFF